MLTVATFALLSGSAVMLTLLYPKVSRANLRLRVMKKALSIAADALQDISEGHTSITALEAREALNRISAALQPSVECLE
jgi:hypothetical protein